MPLPHSSRCCRAINRRIQQPSDAVWIPDSALVAAFDKFFSRPHVTSRRHGSHVPGPLESRRRQGKRHMGELNLGPAHGSAPLWQIANSVDLTQWQWKPPTLFGERHATAYDLDPDQAIPLWRRLQKWLHRPEALEESLDPANDQPSEPEATVASEHQTAESTLSAEISHLVQEADCHIERALTTLHFNATHEDMLSEHSRASYATFCAEFRESVGEQQISIAALDVLITRFPQVLRQQLEVFDIDWRRKTSVRKRLEWQLCNSILDGLSSIKAKPMYQIKHYESVLSTLLARIASLQKMDTRLLTKIMSIMGDQPSLDVWKQTADTMMEYLLFFARKRLSKTAGQNQARLIDQINKMANALGKLNIEAHGAVLDEMTRQMTSQQAKITSKANRIRTTLSLRLCWLHILARSRNVSDEQFAEACASTESNVSTEPLTQRHVCELFLARLNNFHSVGDMTVFYNALKGHTSDVHYAELSRKFWDTGHVTYTKALAAFLLALGRDQDLFHVMRPMQRLADNDSKTLANLAIGMGHPQLAMWIYIGGHQSREAGQLLWESDFSSVVLRQLLNLKTTRADRILDAMGIFARETRPLEDGSYLSRPSSVEFISRQSSLVRYQIQKVERIASALAEAPHLTARTALRHLTRCVAHLRGHGQRVPPPVLNALLQVITRDVAAGKKGVGEAPTRWFLQLLLHETGPEAVFKLDSALREWKDAAVRKMTAGKTEGEGL